MTENNPLDIAQLRAQAAEAKAAAARAEADALTAKLAAAEAALTAAGGDAPPAEAAADPGRAGELTGYAAEVREAYTAAGAVLTLGALLEDREPEPRARVGLPLRTLNRHGLVAGATGTGKTRTLQLMAEGLSDAGVPVFLTDIKGDVTGLAEPGAGSEKLLARTSALGQQWQAATFPVEFYSLGGRGAGIPIRTTVTDFGPLLMAKVLGLNETQESSLALVFHYADQQGLALLDLKDLRALLQFLTGDGKEELKGIGGVSAATAGVILREISGLESQGGDVFFGEPAFDTGDLLRTAADGRGMISSLQLPDLQDSPTLFSTFVMWLLADLFGELPEVGDPDKPKLVFFFDEAHLLFNGASAEFLDQVVRTVRLIRSKGVGIVFVTQSPTDVPEAVLAQLGARVQHALRAHTPKDADSLKKAARTFPTSPYDLTELLPALGTGEAIITVLDEDGRPTPVAPTRLWAPRSSMGPAAAATVEGVVNASPLRERYAEAVDRESAYEILVARAQADEAAAAAAEAQKQEDSQLAAEQKQREKELREAQRRLEKESRGSGRSGSGSGGRRSSTSMTGNAMVDNFLRSAGTQLGREVTRSIFGTRRRR